MPLEKQCASLELSKELKELGYPQESLFYWAFVTDGNEFGYSLEMHNTADETYSAPTVAELLEVLSINDFYSTTHLTYTITEWLCDYRRYRIIEKRLPDALAKMVILAKKDKFIELK